VLAAVFLRSGCPREPGNARFHMEARVIALQQLKGEKQSELGEGIAAEVQVARVHVVDDFILRDKYIDRAKWSPLIYNFRHYFRLADQELGKTFRAEA